MAKFSELNAFVDRALRSRKYPEGTAYNLKNAIKVYEADLNEEEKNSLEEFRKRFDAITRSMMTKNADRMTASSLMSIKSRMSKVLHDFEKYSDPAKMNGWTPKIVSRTKKQKNIQGDRESAPDVPSDQVSNSSVHRIELALRPDSKFILIIPKDVTSAELTMIKTIIDTIPVA